MTTIDHTRTLLRQALARVVNTDAPFLDKAQRIRVAEDGITGALGFLDEIAAAHPQEAAGHWGEVPDPAVLERMQANVDAKIKSGILCNVVCEDEIDEDPVPFEYEDLRVPGASGI